MLQLFTKYHRGFPPFRISSIRHYTYHLEPFVDYENQSTLLEDGSRMLNPLNGPPTFRPYMYPDVSTVFDVFKYAKKMAGEHALCVGRRKVMDGRGIGPFHWITFGEADEQIAKIAHGFRAIGLRIGQEEKIGLLMKNRPEWLLVDQACCAFRNVSVPLYETFGDDSLKFIIEQCEMQAVVCEDVMKAERLLKQTKHLPMLKNLIVIEEKPVEMMDDLIRRGKLIDVRVMTLRQLMRKGELDRKLFQTPSPSDIYTICYTSGTTGLPKGVIITHENALASVTMIDSLPNVVRIRSEISEPQFAFFSFLPFAHVFDRIVQIQVLHMGGRIGYYSGDTQTILEDIAQLRPHQMIAVPRVLDKLYAKVQAELNKSPLKKWLFDLAIAHKERLYKRGVITTDSWADRLVFRRIREAFGGQLQMIAVGSAPIHKDVLKFTRAALGCIVLEGYGMTETSIGNTLCLEGDTTDGHVGPPCIQSMIKLIDAPDCGYTIAKNGGEICVKGPSVTPGYYCNEEETKKTIDEDGWLHTGDIGAWTSEGTLRIVDRKKNLFKLAQGEYIAPEHIEQVYERCPLVQQCLIHGESIRAQIVAIVIPEQEHFVSWCSTLGFTGTRKELCANREIVKAMIARMREEGRIGGLNGYELVSNVMLMDEPFSSENGLLTPTQKYKRRAIVEKMREDIDRMYQELEDQVETFRY